MKILGVLLFFVFRYNHSHLPEKYTIHFAQFGNERYIVFYK